MLLEKLGHDVALLLEFGLQLFDLLVFGRVLPTHVVAVGLALEDNANSLILEFPPSLRLSKRSAKFGSHSGALFCDSKTQVLDLGRHL